MNAVLHVISDRQRRDVNLLHVLKEAAIGGTDVIQIREKKAPALETYSLCESLRAELADVDRQPDVFVNDRVDVALAAYAHGIHLAAKSLPISVVRGIAQRAGRALVIGASVHSLEEAVAAEANGADYITFGHIFESESHQGQTPRGVMALARVVEAVNIPVIAIGGIDASNIGPVLDTGCSGVAVIGAVLYHSSPAKAAANLKDAILASRTKPKVPFPRGGVAVGPSHG